MFTPERFAMRFYPPQVAQGTNPNARYTWANAAQRGLHIARKTCRRLFLWKRRSSVGEHAASLPSIAMLNSHVLRIALV